VGMLVGELLGIIEDGILVGLTEGDMVGTLDGRNDGFIVGDFVRMGVG